MLTIRLQRTGKKNKPDFRIVLAEKESPVSKKFVEILGTYNPRTKAFQVKEERVKYWITQRIELSETVHNLFVTKKFVDAKKVTAFSLPKKVAPAVVAPTEAAAATPAPPAPEATVNTETPAEAAEAVADVASKVEEPAA